MSQFDHARVVKDKEASRDAAAAIRRFNKETPYPTQRISSKDLSQSLKGRIRRRLEFERGQPQSKRQIPIARDVQELHPEVEEEDAGRMR